MKVLTRIIDWFATPYSLFLLLRDPQIFWKTKLKAGLILAGVAFYILNPADLIPDVIPFTGWLDDLVIVPTIMAIAGKIVPEVDIAQIRNTARNNTKRIMFWTVAAFTTLMLIGLSTLGLLIYWIIKTADTGLSY